MQEGSRNVTELLGQLSRGNRQALDELIPLVYDELRRIARGHLAGERGGHTLDSVALVHEAYARLVDQRVLRADNRAHFFATASGVMRRLLVDHARGRKAAKRGGGAAPLTLDGMTAIVSDENCEEMLLLDEALRRLFDIDRLAGQVVECLYFGGLTHDEIAVGLATSVSTVRRRWRFARAWLAQQFGVRPA